MRWNGSIQRSSRGLFGKQILGHQKETRRILIAAPDRSVLKNEKQKLRDFRFNNEVHMHGSLLVPGRSRLKEWVETHFKRYENRYVRNNLLRLKVQPIESTPREVVSYVFDARDRPRDRSVLGEHDKATGGGMISLWSSWAVVFRAKGLATF
jgi:hypothetical protein